MLMNLLIGLTIMIGCLFMQSFLVVAAIGHYRRHGAGADGQSFRSGVLAVSGVMLILVAGNMVQVSLWALLFMLLGEFQHFRDAFYHSATNFATLGYGDMVMSERHRLLGPLEAINGAIMIGLSTAALIATFQDALQKMSRHGQG
jgi:Ion channel